MRNAFCYILLLVKCSCIYKEHLKVNHVLIFKDNEYRIDTDAEYNYSVLGASFSSFMNGGYDVWVYFLN